MSDNGEIPEGALLRLNNYREIRPEDVALTAGDASHASAGGVEEPVNKSAE
jgi:hypothetical protein